MDLNERIVTGEVLGEDSLNEYSLRPKTLDEYIGQDKVIDNLKIYIEAAKKRKDALDQHIREIFSGQTADDRQDNCQQQRQHDHHTDAA